MDFLSTFPAGLTGSSSANTIDFGAGMLPSSPFTRAISSASVTVAPVLVTTTASTDSPHFSCGTPMTAACATAG